MGPRHASVRHSNVVVMAPALTETAQSQNFELTSPSKTVHLPLSLKKYKKKGTYPQADSPDRQPKLSNGVDSSEGMNGHTPPEITYSINGLAKSLKNEFILLEKKDKPGSEKENNTRHKSLDESPIKPLTEAEGPEYTLTQIGGFIMNSSYTPMGDNRETMGLQKSNEDLTETEPGTFSKEKITPGEMDQLFNNLGVAIANEDLATTGELSSQNVEEILQAIDSMEGNGGEVCPTEMTHLESGGGDAMFSISEAADIAGSLTNFERDLFNVVDVMSMCVDESLVTVNKDTLIEERLEEIRKKQFQLKRKYEYLMRRLHKIQVRAVGKHAAEEITGVIEYTNNMLEAANRTRGYGVSDMSESEVNELRVDPKGTSLSSLSLLMRQLDHAATQQASALARSNNSRQCKYFGSGSSNNLGLHISNGMRQGRPGSVLPPFKQEIKLEMEKVAGELHSQLSMVQAEIDSDVTASSSCSESCDEFINYNNQYQHKLTISKRAAWKWAEDRAAVASRCTWLQAQMADLEYKIRQQTEMKRQLRSAKGPVRLADVPSTTDSSSAPPPALSPLQSTHNGYSTDESCSSNSGGAVGAGGGCCSRTRPLVRACFGKRKLVEAWSVGGRMSKKAARGPTLQCSCRPPLNCLLCAGVQPPQPSLTLEVAPVNERLAALDPAYHPVLSFLSDASQSLHYDSILKCAEWQTRAVRIAPGKGASGGGLVQGGGGGGGMAVVGAMAAREAAAATDLAHRRLKKHHSLDPTASPSQASGTPSSHHRNKNSSSMSISAKLKRKIVRGRRRRNPNMPFDRFRQRRKSRALQDGESRGGNIENEAVYDVGDGVPPGNRFSPVPSPTPSKDPKDQFRRKRENSYDIDNIVIPYSIAASTRPEKLHYKEIQTPKWRWVKDEPSENVDHKNGLVRRSSHDNEPEDISDDAVILRHERCEVDEKKKFLSYLKLPNSSLNRGRGQRRTDSRAESSGANTPDPMSPATRDGGGGESSSGGGGGTGAGEGSSPLTSPPATPLADPGGGGHPPPSASPVPSLLPSSDQQTAPPSRRRTVSQSKPEPSKSPPLLQPHNQESYETVAPYERRVFPLSDEVYQKMLSENDSGHYSVIGNSSYNKHYEEVATRRAGSPSSFSTDSAESFLMEDPNDPEWTMSQSTQDSKR